jgi:aminotransferase
MTLPATVTAGTVQPVAHAISGPDMPVAGRGLISRRAARIARMELAGLLRTARAVGAVDLALGIPDGDPPGTALTAAARALVRGGNQYADPAGLPRLRETIAASLRRGRGVAVDPDTEITVTAGATEGVFIALLATTDAGDEVLLPEPFFENYPGMIEAAGAVPRTVPLRRPGWRLDLDELERSIGPRTRAVLLNNPHNPTGRVFDRAEIAGLARICRRHDLVLITDEVYDHFRFDGAEHASPLSDTAPAGFRERSVVVGSFSKAFRMSGWRLGYCVAEPGLTAVLRRVHERTTLGASHPLQQGAAALLPGDLDHDTVRRLQERRDDVTRRLEALGFKVSRPEGGWFVLAGTSAIGWSARELARRLVHEAGVVVAPGGPFFTDEAEGDGWIRIVLIRDAEVTGRAIDAIGRFLDTRTPHIDES